MTTLHTVSFQKTVLASLIGLCLSQSVFALQEISDAGLSETTGEGIALLPENFAMQFNGADDAVGTGYMRYIPVGPLTQAAQDTTKNGVVDGSDHSVGKADIYMYGLALSRADGNSNNRFSGNPIYSWGTAMNPWLLKVITDTDIPNFSATSPTDTGKGDVSYLTLEAPIRPEIVSGLLPDAEKSVNNLKFGVWADAFVRDPNKPEGDPAQFHLGQMFGGASNADRANRLRLQAVWDGFGIHGSRVQVFQTLGGVVNGAPYTAVNGKTYSKGLSTSYNNTLGIAGVLRFNSASGDVRADYNAGATSATTVLNDWVTTAGAAGSGIDGAGCGQSNNYSDVNCQYRFQQRTVRKTVSGLSWAPPTAVSVLQLNTQETTDTGRLTTPALNGGVAPTFRADKGLYLYNPNINLVLGSLYQPLTFGVADDGKNLVFELARIPNKESIYKQVYTAYAGATGTLTPAQIAEYKGSTCNFYQCGNDAKTMNGVDYQGYNATHSSISIGSTTYNAANNTLDAYKGGEALGVAFGKLVTNTVAGTATIDEQQIRFQQRDPTLRVGVVTERYRIYAPAGVSVKDVVNPLASNCAGGASGANCYRWINREGFLEDWRYLTGYDGSGNKVFGYSANFLDQYTVEQSFGRAAASGQVGTVKGQHWDDNLGSGSGSQPPNPTAGGTFMAGFLDCFGGSSAQDCDGRGFMVTSVDPTTNTHTATSTGNNVDSATYTGTYSFTDMGVTPNVVYIAGGTDTSTGETLYIPYGVGVNALRPRANNQKWEGGGAAGTATSRMTGDLCSALGQNPASACAAMASNTNYYGRGWFKATSAEFEILGRQPTSTSTGALNASPSNNFGSAVIDGLLIQHMKITTKGL